LSSPNLFIQLQAILTVSRQAIQTPPYIVNYDFGNPRQSATVELFESFFQATTLGVGVTLPTSPVFAVLVQNLASTGVLQVAHTPAGGSASTCTLGPGGVFIYFDPAESGGGITAVTLTGVLSTIPAMVLVGG